MSMRLPLALLAAIAASPVFAQEGEGPPRGPFVFALDGLYAVQGESDLDGGGSFEVTRSFARAGGLAFLGPGTTVGLFASRGWLDYSFSDPATAPWGDVNDLSVSLPLRFAANDRVSVIVSPALRYDYEDGADQDDAMTYGAFVGAAWEINERLTIGPAFGAFSELGEGGPTLFPALLVDWDITDRLNLSTGPTIGASRGPGLALNYDLGGSMTVGLAGRSESTRFRLNDEGSAPGGIGEDSSFPVVVTFDYEPFPRTGISAFAGMELGGSLRLEDAKGRLIEERDYDPAPVFGAAVRLAF